MTAVLSPRATPFDGLWSRLDQRGRAALVLGLAAGVAFMGAQGPTLARALVGGFGLVIFVVIAFGNRNSALVMVVVWLVLLGLVRRALIPFSGWAEQDPLLLVGPAAAVTFLLAARGSGAPRSHNALSGIAAFLLIWSALQVFNPAETDLLVAVRGVMFWVVPMLWFFVGRTLSAEQHERILGAVFWVAIVVIAWGLYQTFVGLLPFEFTWVGVANQNVAIFMPGFRIRPFSTLTSPQEYGQFLAFAIMIISARLLHLPRFEVQKRRWMTIFLIAAGVALFYQGTRTSMVFGILALAVMTVMRFRSPALFLLIIVAGAVLTQWVGSQDVQKHNDVAAAEVGGADILANHTLAGLTNPTDSTLPLHIELIEQSMAKGIRSPFGIGVSHKTIAGLKAGTVQGPSAENDVANTMESLGTLAGFAYIAFIGIALYSAGRSYRRHLNARHLAWLGMLIAALSQWWMGQMYATSTLLFLALGGLAAETSEGARLLERPGGSPRVQRAVND